jgi:hypothetical protein
MGCHSCSQKLFVDVVVARRRNIRKLIRVHFRKLLYCTTAVFIGLGFLLDPLATRFLEVADELVDAKQKKVCCR